MTQQTIEAFLAVVRTGSLSGAAQSLYITQPAVSRHLRALERDLDCTLLLRQRGRRQVELTEQGRDFVRVAEKWQLVWREAREVAQRDQRHTIRVASVGSVSTYLLPQVFRTFLEEDPGRTLNFFSYHTREAYDYVAEGKADIAFVSHGISHPQVETVPAFREEMLLLTGPGCPWPERVHPSQLDPAKELRLPWSPEYDQWHACWFSSGVGPRALLDQMSLLENLFGWQGAWADSWAAAPAMVALSLRERHGLEVRRLEEGPSDEIVYYLLGQRRKSELVDAFLDCLGRELSRHPEVQSYLKQPAETGR